MSCVKQTFFIFIFTSFLCDKSSKIQISFLNFIAFHFLMGHFEEKEDERN